MFNYPRISAGIYEIQKDSIVVGFIRKQNASKWIVTDVVDTPQHVTKTLKEAKSAVENLIIFNTESQEVDNNPKPDYNHSVRDEDDKVVNTLELQKQMLASMKTYTLDEFGNFVQVKQEILEPVEV